MITQILRIKSIDHLRVAVIWEKCSFINASCHLLFYQVMHCIKMRQLGWKKKKMKNKNYSYCKHAYCLVSITQISSQNCSLKCSHRLVNSKKKNNLRKKKDSNTHKLVIWGLRWYKIPHINYKKTSNISVPRLQMTKACTT